MPETQTNSSDRDARLQEVLLAYLRCVDAGSPPDREELMRRHPDLADDLRTFFADQDRLDRLTAPLRRERQPGGLGRVPYFGDYELLEEIARGGMGVVYKARQNSLQRVVALKMIRAGALATPEELERFRKESQEAAGLDHPNIVPVYEVSSHEGQAYFTMKYFPDGNLASHLPELRKDVREAVRILAAVARAIDHAHRHGVLHRDLKPANILLAHSKRGHSSFSPAAGEKDECPLFEPHVADFGLAKRLAGDSAVTQSGQIVGTPSYMAPEQAAGKGSRVTPAIDVYALGAILYEVLTGRPPFRAETPLGTLMQVIHEEPPRPRGLQARTDRVLEAICLKCLEKDPGRRYPSAIRLAEDLERWLNGEPVSVRVGWWHRRRRRSRPMITMAALLILVGILAACGLMSTAQFYTVAQLERDRAQQMAEEAMRAEMAARVQAEEAKRRQEVFLYQQHLAQAQREWEQNNVPKALELLDQARDVRGWEWHYLRRQPLGSGLKLESVKPVKEDEVRAATFRPDGKQLASAHRNGRILLWDTATGKLIREVTAGALLTRIAFAPDCSRLAAGNADGNVTVFAETGEKVLSFHAHKTEVTGLAYSPDGRYLATSGGKGGPDGSALLWDAAKGERIRLVAQGGTVVRGLAFSPDGRRLATGDSEGTLRVWNIPDGQIVLQNQGHGGGIDSLAWSPDAGRLAVAGKDRIVRFRDVNRWQEVFTLPQQPSPIVAMTFSPDGRRLATLGSDGPVKLWDTERGAELLSPGNGKAFLVFSPDGRFLATGSKDGWIQVWDGTPLEEKPGTMKKAD